MKNLYISAGHYGYSSGAVVGDVKEADLNKKFLDAINFGIKVPEGSLRSKIDWVNARATKDDIAIEIHCNYSSNENKRGVEVYFRDEDDKKLAILLDELMIKKGFSLLGGFKDIEVYDTLGCDQQYGSIHHDSESFVQSLGWCRELKCPAVILEVEYMSNPKGMEVLQNAVTPILVAKAIREVYNPVIEPTVACEVEKVVIEEQKKKISNLQRLVQWFINNFKK